MMQSQPMPAVENVAAASAWFQNVLGLKSGHGGDEYERAKANSAEILDGPLVNPNSHLNEI